MTFTPFQFISSQRVKATLTALGITLLIGGCATIDSASTNSTADSAAYASRVYDKSIDLDGRLSVQYQRDDKDESVHGSFTWRQTDARTMITLLSPLGQIIATIDVSPNNATLMQSGHESRIALDVDELALQSLGWPLPVSGLRTWLQGFAVDQNGKRFVATPSGNRVTTQDGWQITYVTWDDSDSAHPHPKRIDLTRQTQQAGQVDMRIVIDKWQAN